VSRENRIDTIEFGDDAARLEMLGLERPDVRLAPARKARPGEHLASDWAVGSAFEAILRCFHRNQCPARQSTTITSRKRTQSKLSQRA
jgi:hypothetical protein